MKFNLQARATAEFLGTGFLVAAVVGSGIMGERPAGGNVAVALLANTIATGAALVALILTFGSISGQTEHRVSKNSAGNPPSALCGNVERNLRPGKPVLYRIGKVTAGFKCAPERRPHRQSIANAPGSAPAILRRDKSR
jgi:glycerol uptake facilitator-like aquaporin